MAILRWCKTDDWPEDITLNDSEGFNAMTSFIKVVIQAIRGHKYAMEIAATAMNHLTWLHERQAEGQLATAWYVDMSQDDAPWVEAHWIPVICQAISEVPVTLVLPSAHRFNNHTCRLCPSLSSVIPCMALVSIMDTLQLESPSNGYTEMA